MPTSALWDLRWRCDMVAISTAHARIPVSICPQPCNCLFSGNKNKHEIVMKSKEMSLSHDLKAYQMSEAEALHEWVLVFILQLSYFPIFTLIMY